MTHPGGTHLNLLLFSAGGVCFGMDAGQVESMAAYNGELHDDLYWFHALMNYGDTAIGYSSPAILSIKTACNRTSRVIVDSLEDIAEYGLNDIHPFPALIEPFARRYGMWGILPRNGKTVLLVDMHRLIHDTELK